MSRLFNAAERTARIGSAAAFLWITLAGAEAQAAPRDNNRPAMVESDEVGAGSSSDLPMLPTARTPALQLLWFDPSRALPAPATEALADEVRSIFRELGVEVAFRVATPDTTYGDSAVPEVPIILLKDDPIPARRPTRVLGLIVRNQEPNRAVWAFLENVRWTLGLEKDRGLRAAGSGLDLGQALGRVVAHEVIHALAPEEPHSKNGLMGHSMNRAFLLGDHAPLEARCGRAFLEGLAARGSHPPAQNPAATLASGR
jgi:hypothetical protein